MIGMNWLLCVNNLFVVFNWVCIFNISKSHGYLISNQEDFVQVPLAVEIDIVHGVFILHATIHENHLNKRKFPFE